MMFYEEAKVISRLRELLQLFVSIPKPYTCFDSSSRMWNTNCKQGILYLLSPITFTLLTRYPHLQRHCAIVGLVLTVVGSLLSSFSVYVWHLIATQGVLCAIGNGLLFSPTTLYLDQWFIQRKGLAYGIMWAAKSVAGVALPFVASACLEKFGSRTTLRAWTVTTVCCLHPTSYD